MARPENLGAKSSARVATRVRLRDALIGSNQPKTINSYDRDHKTRGQNEKTEAEEKQNRANRWDTEETRARSGPRKKEERGESEKRCGEGLEGGSTGAAATRGAPPSNSVRRAVERSPVSRYVPAGRDYFERPVTRSFRSRSFQQVAPSSAHRSTERARGPLLGEIQEGPPRSCAPVFSVLTREIRVVPCLAVRTCATVPSGPDRKWEATPMIN